MPQTFLLEIGTEEIPARFMESALEQLRELAQKALLEERLEFGEIAVYGTPRRLALLVKGLEEVQKERVEEVKGPACRVAFDAEGKFTRAAEGFARSQGVKVEDLVVRSTPAGDYVFAVKKEVGRPTAEVMQRVIPGLITGLSFPRPMRWAYTELRFARPIRWLVALLGDEVIPFELEGVRSDRYTYGHRFLSRGPIALEKADDYLAQLEAHYVIADQVRRREMIWVQVQAVAAQEGGKVERDEDLLEEVTYLLEYPTAFCGSFPEKFLVLPPEVLITTMREHQRYFPVHDQEGKLMARFIAVRNGTAEHIDVVREGNEKVLVARLADARFFFEEDMKHPLVQQVNKLEKIVFQESLGMMYGKVQRIQKLTEFLTDCLGWEKERRKDAARVAFLAKADLVTSMVYEFPELQGIMGAEYARRQGEKPEVAQAIREHYQPRFAGDTLPETELGAVVGLADRLDTLVGCFAVGIQPTGSQDPYALRRQALGICHLLLDRQWDIPLRKLIKAAYDQYLSFPAISLKLTYEEVEAELMEFFKQRLRNLLLDRDISYDVADAVLAAGYECIPDLFRRAEAVQQFRSRPEFANLFTAYTRANNLSRHLEAVEEVYVERFVSEVEKLLYESLQRVDKEMQAALLARDLGTALLSFSALHEPLAEFFNGVMVMVEDASLRSNRLALLQRVVALGKRVADFSKIVVENQGN